MSEALDELFLLGEEKMEKLLRNYTENSAQSVQAEPIR